MGSFKRLPALSASPPGLEAGARPSPERGRPPRSIPMLASIGGQPFDSPSYIFEVKWNGVRALAFPGAKEVGYRTDTCGTLRSGTRSCSGSPGGCLPSFLAAEAAMVSDLRLSGGGRLLRYRQAAVRDSRAYGRSKAKISLPPRP